MKLLERFCMAYIRAELPTWYYKVWLSLQTVALFKTAEKTDVRPIGLRNSLVKVIHREVMKKCKNEISQHLGANTARNVHGGGCETFLLCRRCHQS